MRAKSAMPQKVTNIQAEIEQQQQKSKILDEDRKNFHHQAEEIKQKNKQEIEKLKAENMHLKNVRDEYIANRKQRRPFTAQDQSLSSTNQLGSFIKDENYLRRLLDKQRHLTKTKKAALFSLQDKLKQVEENKLGFIEENPLMRNIRVLENRLDKVMIKYNQAQSIQKTYEEVVKRLREQRVGYDNQLSIIESSLKGKQKDFEQLLLLAHDAAHAKQAAFGQLKRFQQRRVTVQDMRVKYISQKKTQLTKQSPSNQMEQIRNFQRRDNSSPKLIQGTGNSYQYDDQYQKQQLNDYEQAFRKLKQVTGVIDANQIIQKFKTQGLTTASLQQLRQNYKNKIQKLRAQKQQIKRQLETNRLVLERGKDERRRVDQIQSQSAQISNQLQRTNLKQKKLSSSYINIKAGIQHLKDLTKFYKREGDNGGDQIEEDLKSLNEKLRRMYDIVRNDPQYLKRSYKASACVIQDMIQGRDVGFGDQDDD